MPPPECRFVAGERDFDPAREGHRPFARHPIHDLTSGDRTNAVDLPLDTNVLRVPVEAEQLAHGACTLAARRVEKREIVERKLAHEAPGDLAPSAFGARPGQPDRGIGCCRPADRIRA